MSADFAIGDRVRLKPGARIRRRGKDHRPGREGVIIDLLDVPGQAIIQFRSPTGRGMGRGSKSVELLSKFERVEDPDFKRKLDAIRQGRRQGRGSKFVELLPRTAPSSDPERSQKLDAIRQACLEQAGFRMRPDGTYFKGGN